jgi:Tol biopolymer transport system component
MKLRPHTSLINLLLTCVCLSCATSHNDDKTVSDIPYPRPLPDSTAIPFLPGVVSKDSLDFNAAFSPDGKSFYFTRSENKQLKMYVTRHDGENWTEPIHALFTETKYSAADPAFAPDGKLYFISNRPVDQSDTFPDYDIWFVTPLPDGRWSEPENLKSANSDSSEFYISFSTNGNLYFSSSRAGGFGEEDIYVSRLIDGQYATPENLGIAINSEKSEYDPCISANEDLLVFTSSNREDTFGKGDLYFAKRNENRNWLQAFNAGKNFNTSSREYCAYFSPDSRYFFFTSDGDVKWMNAQFVRKQIEKSIK